MATIPKAAAQEINKLQSARSTLEYLGKESPSLKTTGNIVARMLQQYELSRIKRKRNRELLAKRKEQQQSQTKSVIERWGK